MKNSKGFASMIGLIISLAIVCLLGYFAIKKYYAAPNVEQPVSQALKEQGIDTAAPLSAIDAAQQKVDAANKASAELEKQAQQVEN